MHSELWARMKNKVKLIMKAVLKHLWIMSLLENYSPVWSQNKARGVPKAIWLSPTTDCIVFENWTKGCGTWDQRKAVITSDSFETWQPHDQVLYLWKSRCNQNLESNRDWPLLCIQQRHFSFLAQLRGENFLLLSRMWVIAVTSLHSDCLLIKKW